jgi:hypothetical protein
MTPRSVAIQTHCFRASNASFGRLHLLRFGCAGTHEEACRADLVGDRRGGGRPAELRGASPHNCAGAVTIAVTVVAGPLKHLGVNRKRHVPNAAALELSLAGFGGPVRTNTSAAVIGGGPARGIRRTSRASWRPREVTATNEGTSRLRDAPRYHSDCAFSRAPGGVGWRRTVRALAGEQAWSLFRAHPRDQGTNAWKPADRGPRCDAPTQRRNTLHRCQAWPRTPPVARPAPVPGICPTAPPG